MFFKNKKDIKNILNKIHSRKNTVLDRLRLSRLILKDAEMSGLDLSNIDFRKSRFIKCRFINSSLKGSNLKSARFDGCSLINVNMEFTNIEKARFENSVFNNADLRNARGQEAAFFRARMDNVLFEGADFCSSIIKNSSANNIKARGALFKTALFSNNNIMDSDFTSAYFNEALLENNRFENILFTAAILNGAEINKCQFIKPNFFKAEFKNVYFLTRDLRQLIEINGGLVSPQYLKIIWNNIYSRAVIILTGIFICYLVIINIISPVYWSVERTIRVSENARKKGNLEQALLYLKIKSATTTSKEKKLDLKLALARVYDEMARYEKAEKIYRDIAMSENKQYKMEAYWGMGHLYRMQKRFQESIDSYKKSCSLIPRSDIDRRAHNYLLIGDVYRDSNNFTEAIRYYENVINNKKFDMFFRTVGKVGLVDALIKQGSYNEALKICEDLLKNRKVGQYKNTIYYHLIDIYTNTGKLEEAKKIYREVLKFKNKDMDIADKYRKRLNP